MTCWCVCVGEELLGRFFKTRQGVSCSVLARDMDPHRSLASNTMVPQQCLIINM